MRRGTLGSVAALLILVALMLLPQGSFAEDAQAPAPDNKNTIMFFWGGTCPHCAKEWEFLRRMQQEYPQLVIRDFEVWNNEDNARIFKEFMERMGQKQVAVPVTIIGGQVYVGFPEDDTSRMEESIMELLGLEQPSVSGGRMREDNTIDVPFVGRVDPVEYSLPVFTLIIAGLDSINPCALYVLLFLLSLMIHARSRSRMLIIGGTFVFFSGFVYFIFMAAWLNIFLIAGRVSYVTGIAGAVALVIAVINIKDYFAFKKGVSLTMSDEAQGKIIKRMRGMLNAKSMLSMLTGAVVLATLANAYELLCTAGFPMIYTRVLTLNNLDTAGYYTYLVFYNAVYVLPLLTVVLIFTATLGSRKLTEEQGRALKLVSGTMMLVLGSVLLISPGQLNNVFSAIGMLGTAMVLAWILSLFKSLKDGEDKG